MPDARVAISLGSNQGDSCENIRSAAEKLTAVGVDNMTLSPLYKTSPVDCPDGAPDFVNAALTGTTRLSAKELLAACRSVEDTMGRPRVRGYHEDRVIDLDLLMYDDLVTNTDELVLPHPEMTNRLFVLAPLADVAGEWLVPLANVTVNACLKRLDPGDEHVVCLRD